MILIIFDVIKHAQTRLIWACIFIFVKLSVMNMAWRIKKFLHALWFISWSKIKQPCSTYRQWWQHYIHNTFCLINLNIRAHDLGHRKRLGLFIVLITMYYEPENYTGCLIINRMLLMLKVKLLFNCACRIFLGYLSKFYDHFGTIE